MSVLNQSFLTDMESRMQWITENEYLKIAADQWWTRVCKSRPSSSKSETLEWMLNTGAIEQVPEGTVAFEDLVTQKTDLEALFYGLKALKLKRSQLEDADGNGISYAASWSSQAAALMAIHPQDLLTQAILAGESALGYDGVAFFSTAHPINPYASGLGNYANLFTSTASSAYPGALKIDSSVAVDVAAANVYKAIAYIKQIKAPNGKHARRLTPVALMGPPALEDRMIMISEAQYLSTTNGGPNDYRAVLRKYGLGEPIVVPELGAAFTGGSDTSWYIVCEETTGSELGGFVYLERKAFEIMYYGPMNDAQLQKLDEFEWTGKGRSAVDYGHPYAVFKAKAS